MIPHAERAYARRATAGLHRVASPLLTLWLLGSPAVVAAQAAALSAPTELSTTQDARVTPKGVVRLRVLNVWTRFDAVFTDRGLQPLGASLSADSLGVEQLPALAATQTAARQLTGAPNLRVSLGALRTTADSRVVTTPISLEYGLTRRLAISVTVPIVETRTTLLSELNRRDSNANVGINPAIASPTLYGATLRLTQALTSAQSALQSQLQSCQSNPGGTNCSTILARQSEVQQLLQSTSNVVTGISTLYGVSATQPGTAFVPSRNGALHSLIVARLDTMAALYKTFLGSSVSITDRPAGAVPLGATAFTQLATDVRYGGFDSLATVNHLGVGDVELGAAFQLVDHIGDTTIAMTGPRLRAAVQGIVRLGTGSPSPGTMPFDIGTGTGQLGLVGRAMMDLLWSTRWMASFAGQATVYPGSATVSRPPYRGYALFPLQPPESGPAQWTPGNAFQIEAAPRYLLTDLFTLSAHYVLRHQGGESFTGQSVAIPDAGAVAAPPRGGQFDAVTEQRIGFGIAYSSVAAYQKGRSALPLEMSFTHLETITASGAPTPKLFREQIEARIYYRVRRGGK